MSASSRRDDWSAWRTCLVLAVFALLVCVRMPQIIIKGRFWAEEGKIFFVHAWTMPPWQAIWSPFGGYLNLVANTATVAARWLLPLGWAPYLTILTGLLFQAFPPLLILTARDAWLASSTVRIAAVLAILLVPVSEEVWLQTLHCQFQLALACGIILALQPRGGGAGAFRLALLALGPLSGPSASALLPLFAARALQDRSAARGVQTLVLGASTGAQLLLFYSHASVRSYTLDPVILLSTMTVKYVVTPFLGIDDGIRVTAALQRSIGAGHVPWAGVLAAPLLFGLFGLAGLRHGRKAPVVWLLLAGASCAAIASFGAIQRGAQMVDVYFGARYAFAPEVLFVLAVIALAASASGWTAFIARITALWLIVIGAFAYMNIPRDFANGPAFRKEVAAWRADPRHALYIWPNGWTMSLPTIAASHVAQ